MQIKFLCLNVWQGGNLMEGMLEFIKAEDPDILALQEVYDGHDDAWKPQYRTIDVLREVLPQLEYAHFAPTFLEVKDFGKLDQGNAVFSKFPIVDSKITFFDVPYAERIEDPKYFPNTPRNLEHVVIQAGSKEVNVFNTQGIWGTDGFDNQRRLAMADSVVSEIKGHARSILCGDFNVFMNTDTVRKFSPHVVSIFAETPKTTFNVRIKNQPGFTPGAVDGIFTSPDVKVLDARCMDIDVSDHLPLVATLEI